MINIIEARKKAALLKKSADALLGMHGVRAILDSLGIVRFTGSYAADVMVKPDIDLQIINPDINRSDVVRLAEFFMSLKGNYSVEIADGTEYRRSSGHPYGYYVGVWQMHNGVKWKMDIWLLKEAQEINDTPYLSLKKHDWYKSLSTAEKDAIILIKHQLCELKEYDKYASANVYESVITGGVRSLAEFYDWAKHFDTNQLFVR